MNFTGIIRECVWNISFSYIDMHYKWEIIFFSPVKSVFIDRKFYCYRLESVFLFSSETLKYKNLYIDNIFIGNCDKETVWIEFSLI